MTFGSVPWARTTASSSPSGASTLTMPREDPARAGLTNTGKLSVRAISSRIRPRSVRQRRGVTSTYGATSIPADWRTTFM